MTLSGETLGVLSGAGFRTGLAYGLAALIIGLVAGMVFKRARGTPAPIGGLLFSVSALLAIPVSRTVPSEAWIGAALLAAAGGLPVLRRFGAIAAIPGAWFVAFGSNPPGPSGFSWFILVAIALAAPLVADFDRRHRGRAIAPPLFAMSVLGIFFTVPDTEAAAVALGVAVLLALLDWPLPLCSFGVSGSFAAVGVLFWIIAVEGVGRPSSMIGAAACLGILVAEPAGYRLSRTGSTSTGYRLHPALLGAVHLPLVFVASRVAGVRPAAWQAALIAVPLLASAALLTAHLGREQVRGNRPHGPTDRGSERGSPAH